MRTPMLLLLAAALTAADPAPTLAAAAVPAVGEPDPTAALWRDIVPVPVTMLPQSIAAPASTAVEVPTLHLQLAKDATQLAVRVSWADAEPDTGVDSARFGDAVAIQFPLTPHASVLMGLGGKVQILHWKAVWQKDVNDGFQDVHILHPNTWADLYWFAQGQHPYPLATAFEDPRSRQWLVAWSAGNPLSDFQRREPCEEAVAAGFGTLTTQKAQATRARGVWAAGTWAVVFQRPLRSEDADDAQLASGTQQLACAVWQGGAGQVGARKQWSNWIPFTLP